MSKVEKAAIPGFLDREDANGRGGDAVSYARVFYPQGLCQPDARYHMGWVISVSVVIKVLLVRPALSIAIYLKRNIQEGMRL